MKKYLHLALWALCLFPLAATGQDFTTQPAFPSPGDSITIVYEAGQGPLKNAEQISASIYMLNDGFPENKEVQIPLPRPLPIHISLHKKRGAFIGSFKTSADTKFMKVILYTPDRELDHDGGRGYPVTMFHKGSEKAVQGAKAQEALSKLTHAYYIGIQIKEQEAFEDLSEEFKNYPSSMDHFVYYMTYAGLAMQFNKLKELSKVKSRLQSLLERPSPGETELSLAFSLAQMLEMPEEQETSFKKIKERFPKSFVVEFEVQDQFYESTDLEEKEKLYQFLSQEFNETERQRQSLRDAAMVLANAFLSTDIDKFIKYAVLAKNREQLASQANATAWQFIGQGIDYPAIDLDKAEKLVEVAIEIIQGQISDLQESNNGGQIQYLRLNEYYAAFADTYALVLYKKGELKKALEYQEISLQNDPDPATEVVDRYAIYFDQLNEREATKAMLAQKIKNRQASERMKERFVELAGKKELKALLEVSNQRYFDQIREQMIQQEAPGFSLKNLEGDIVQLADFKGKVVVLDFWATWCAPCIASFPGMNQLAEQYRNDPEVEFLFINCWESEGTTPATLSEFLDREGYSFNVLIDEANKVVQKYGVEGIPAKFVIDRNGQIRFSDSGFRGVDHLVNELGAKIEILKVE